MTRLPVLLALLALLPAAARPAAAASSPWFESEGGAVRIVTSGLADAQGYVRGALDIRLKPGWKTYWREPGEAGVPPHITLWQTSDLAEAEILFPTPERISQDGATWAGYRQSVSLPVLFKARAPGAAGILEGSVFLGICETICIPVDATFSFDTGADPDNPADAIAVNAAFAALPAPPRPGFRVAETRREGRKLLLEAELPEGAGPAVLFLAGPSGARLSMPVLQARDGTKAVFAAELLAAPEEAGPLHYTLVAGTRAVGGTIALP
ncbi:protein-disulfide reductase DsbD domain-containing protein [Chelativorans intermedius]|uniref:Protein-disulfide reductase DsbD domain-containing protein n=1 Tax=Chelativorans intermedius TaxID=515947 RepID=A0ABV6DAB3_9HYPH|nr:protein-disulfide reductase DsbD domain-containing protein [Chelativorans intermedius]MCT8998656.1 protein-disulfide reductase DsbD family protein [Chelativorans intermedius]